jgi:hypothetical protein
MRLKLFYLPLVVFAASVAAFGQVDHASITDSTDHAAVVLG